MKQNVEIISLIYKSIDFLDFIVNQLQSDFCKSDNLDVGVRLICNDATNEVLEHIKSKNIAYSIYNDPKPNDYYLNRVYRAWNYAGMSTSYDNIIFVNSDMAFSKDWLDNLFKHHNGINVPCSRLVESGKLPSGKWARSYNFGTTPANFNKQAWEDSANVSKIDSIGSHGLYMPCLMTAKTFKATGGFPEGNVYSGGIGVHTTQFIKSGDDYYFHDILENRYNMKHITVFDSLVYHIQEGEKDEESMPLNYKKVRNFFTEYSLLSKKYFNHDGDINDSVDGSGNLPSIDLEKGQLMYNYITKKINKPDPLMLDFGTGLGYILQCSDKVFGFEGSQKLASLSNSDKSKICVIDFTKPVCDTRLKKQFDITTSFEVIEHIPRTSQCAFWANVAYVSDYHLCSIHIANDEHELHKTIASKNSWLSFFEKTGIEVEDIQEEFPIKEWTCSIFFLLNLKNYKPISSDEVKQTLPYDRNNL